MTDKMTKRERVEAALNLQPVDRVPLYDLLRNDAAIEYYGGEPLTIENGLSVACKAVANCLDLTRSIVGPAEPRTIDHGNGWVYQQDRWTTWLISRPFDTTKGAAEWMRNHIEARDKDKSSLKEHAEGFRQHFMHLQELVGDSVIVHAETGVGIDDLYHSIGWENFAYLMADEPDLISEWLETHTNHMVKWIHAIADYKLSPVALTFGDIACKGTTLMSPDWLRREFMPRIKRINDAWHEHGVKCMFHSDGYLMEIMPDLMETGMDGLNPIEICAGMSVEEVKRLYGDRIFLAGGIDVSQLLPYGTPEEVKSACLQAIQDTGGMGFLMGSSTELHNAVPLENFKAMVEAAWETKLG